MADGRIDPARERDLENPATSAGFFVARAPMSLRERAVATGARIARPSIEPLAQRGYELERIHELGVPIALALMEAGFIGVVATKLYGVHPAALALISAAPMFGNLSSALWARWAQGHPKVPFIVRLELGLLACIAVIAVLPEGPRGAMLLVVCHVASRLLLGGVIALRSLVWTLNYPRAVRGRVTSRLAMISAGTITVASMLGGAVLDANPQNFRWVYGTGVLLALVGVVALSRVRIIDEQRHLEEEQAAAGMREGGAPPFWAGLVGVLRDDPIYARYLSWQFLLGVANMMLDGPLIYLVSRELSASYSASVAITIVIPFGLALLTIPLWAVYIDRVHVSEFRSRHSWLFAGSQLVLFAGALSGSLVAIALARMVFGVARGGGMLAWQLGHNDFAARDRVGLYMGVHVSLTGLRGAFAPFLGMLLYVGWEPLELAGVELAGFSGIGPGLMLLSSLLSVVACLGFVRLHREIAAKADA